MFKKYLILTRYKYDAITVSRGRSQNRFSAFLNHSKNTIKSLDKNLKNCYSDNTEILYRKRQFMRNMVVKETTNKNGYPECRIEAVVFNDTYIEATIALNSANIQEYNYSVVYSKRGIDRRNKEIFNIKKTDVYNVSFLEQLVQFFVNKKQQELLYEKYNDEKNDDKDYSFDINFREHNDEKSSKFLKKHKNNVFNRDMILHYFLLHSIIKFDNKEIKEIIQTYNTMFPEDNNVYSLDFGYIDLYKYCNPAFVTLTDDEILYLIQTHNYNSLLLSIFNRDIKFYKLWIKLSVIATHKKDYKDSSMLVKDFNINNVKHKNFKNIQKYVDNIVFVYETEYSDEYLDYVNSLTVAEFLKIQKYADFYTTNLTILKHVAQTLSNNELIIVSNNDVESALHIITELSKNNLSLSYDFSTLHKLLSSNITSIFSNFSLKFVVDYINNTMCNGDYLVTNTEINVLNYILHNFDKVGLKMKNYYAAILIHSMSKIMSPTEIVSLVQCVYEHETKVELDKLFDYVDNYDEYKDMPVSWCLELV